MMQEKEAEIAELRGAVGMGSTPASNQSLDFAQFITWALLAGVILVGLYIALRLRSASRR